MGYRVYYGLTPKSYTHVISTERPAATLKNLDPNRSYFCAVSAFNEKLVQSSLSAEVRIAPVQPSKHRPAPLQAGIRALERTETIFQHLVSRIHGPEVTYANAPTERYDLDGKTYLAVRYTADPQLFRFLRIEVQRSTARDELGWRSDEAVFVSAWPSREHPGLLEFLYRSPAPIGRNSREFFRLRYRALFNAKDSSTLEELERAAAEVIGKTKSASPQGGSSITNLKK